jgi:hypothetical protein
VSNPFAVVAAATNTPWSPAGIRSSLRTGVSGLIETIGWTRLGRDLKAVVLLREELRREIQKRRLIVDMEDTNRVRHK